MNGRCRRSKASLLDKKLLWYGAAAAGATLSMSADAVAGIVYPSLGAGTVLTPGQTFSIDFNGDATVDIRFPYPSWGSFFAQGGGPSNGAYVLGTYVVNDDLKALSAGYVIGPAAANWGVPYYDFWQGANGQWPGQSHKFMGVRFP